MLVISRFTLPEDLFFYHLLNLHLYATNTTTTIHACLRANAKRHVIEMFDEEYDA